MDLIIKNGKVVNSNERNLMDIGIKDGKIVALGNSAYWEEAKTTIDAAGKYVIPGLLDSHTHIASPGAFPSLDDYYSGSIAAAYGGTTTFVDFAFVGDGETPRQALKRKLAQAEGNCVVDYAFHPCINSADEMSFQEIEELLDEGFSSVKIFTVYRGNLMLEAGGVYRILQTVAKKDALAMVHAENAELIEYNIRNDIAAGRTSVWDHAQSRPVISEVTAFANVIEMVKETGAAVLFAHMTTGKTAQVLQQARQAGCRVYTETCPHYLSLSDSVYKQEDGCKFVCSPPIRPTEDREALWDLVRSGAVSVVNSDHTDFSTEQKYQNKDYYPGIPNGLPTLETRGIVFFSESVAKGIIDMERFVQLTSTNIAKLMGLYPRKGTIQVGSDADIVVLDPEAHQVIRAKDMHMKTDYSPYEGKEITGAITDTIVRGNPIIRNGRFTETVFRGSLQKRAKPVFE